MTKPEGEDKIYTMEANVKLPPSFSGVGSDQDPLKFVNEFYEAAA
jgi:hypothetical protein